MIGSQAITWGNVHVSTVFVVTPEGVCSAVKRVHITMTRVTFTTMIVGGMELIWDVEDFETIEIDISVSECAVEDDLLMFPELDEFADGPVIDYDTVRLLDQLERETRRNSQG